MSTFRRAFYPDGIRYTLRERGREHSETLRHAVSVFAFLINRGETITGDEFAGRIARLCAPGGRRDACIRAILAA
jgi:hypothetical protein